MNKVSIITVNYNQPEVTVEFLNSIKDQDYANLEVIVVDNGSDVDYYDRLIEAYPDLIFVKSQENLGFAGGNNLGIEWATGDYLFFVNNDTVIPAGTIAGLVESLQLPHAGIVCPLIYYFDQPDLLQYAGYSKINLLTGRNATLGQYQPWNRSNQIKTTTYPHGAAMMISREVLDEVGRMAENYFLYYEELDWGARIKDQGYKCFVDHRVAIYHKESVSTGKNSLLKTYFLTRNRLLFMRKHFSVWKRIPFLIFFTLFSIPKNLLGFIFSRSPKHISAFLSGILWNLKNGIESTQLGYKYNALSKKRNDTIAISKVGKAA